MQIKIDPALVERYIMELAKFGAHGETGVWRTVYSPAWIGATKQFAAWCEEAGLTARHDAVGNVWGVLKGSAGGKSIVSGSHIDTQRPGGRYDGALGLLAALIAIRALKEQFGRPKRTLEAVAFCEEESSRFPTTNFWGSSAITGHIAPGTAEKMKGYADETMADAMRAIGLDPDRIPDAKRDDIDTFLELHVEQGPILEHGGYQVAVVDAITGLRHYRVTLTGTQNHAGAFPMDLRQDPMAGFAEIAAGVIDTATKMGRPAVTTIGRVMVEPNFPAVVPGKVNFVIDARHPDPKARLEMYARHEALMKEVAARRGLKIEWDVAVNHEPCLSDPGLVQTLQDAAKAQGIPAMTMPSGAGHDSQEMASIAKVAMVFVRSKDGRSHTIEEFSSIEDIVAGIRVLAAAMHALAY
ncbi:MAG: Zn-dependent hydrolase [Proteobacteria bacterium]|nr:Zn-dependent hydrolase [Pseudomonadota bacterium]MCA0200033.1 Zn-dependent hydrolase [Pseudomonadota bacterium]